MRVCARITQTFPAYRAFILIQPHETGRCSRYAASERAAHMRFKWVRPEPIDRPCSPETNGPAGPGDAEAREARDAGLRDEGSGGYGGNARRECRGGHGHVRRDTGREARGAGHGARGAGVRGAGRADGGKSKRTVGPLGVIATQSGQRCDLAGPARGRHDTAAGSCSSRGAEPGSACGSADSRTPVCGF
jgi:hypothetical protein